MPGIYFKDKAVDISFFHNGETRIFSLELPENIGGELVFSDESCFIKCFERIQEWLHGQNSLNPEDSEYVVGIPTSYGIIEKTRLIQFAKRNHVPLLRMQSYTMACALSIYYKGICKNDFMAAVIRNDRLEICEFDAGDEVLEMMTSFIADERESAESEYTFKYPGGLESSKTLNVYAIGGKDDLDELSRYLLETRRKVYSDEIEKIGWKVHALEEENISAGLAYYCNRLYKRKGILCLDLVSSSDVMVSVNQNLFNVIKSDSVSPFRISKMFIQPVDADESEDLDIIVFDRFGYNDIHDKSRKGKKCLFSNLPDFKIKRGREYNIVFEVDPGFHIQITIQETDSEERFSFSLEDVLAPYCSAKENRTEQNHSGSRSVSSGSVVSGSASSGAVSPGSVVSESASSGSVSPGSVSSESAFPESVNGPEALAVFFPVIDNLSYALDYAEPEPDPYAQGMVSIYRQAIKILQNNGIERIGEKGERFDYRIHNAVSHVNDPSLPDSCVKKVIRYGYRMDQKLLRYADVIVAN